MIFIWIFQQCLCSFFVLLQNAIFVTYCAENTKDGAGVYDVQITFSYEY